MVYADLRWPAGTGIGVVQRSVLERMPSHIHLIDLGIQLRIGSPLSPSAVALALRKHDNSGVFWSPGFIPPLWSRMPSVVTVHDLIHLHYHTKWHALYYDLLLRYLYRRCEAIICVSDFTRREFLDWSGVPAERVTVIHNGVALPKAVSGVSPSLPFQYVLYPGNRRRHKNLGTLLIAFAASRLPKEGIRLVLTGPPDPELCTRALGLGIEKSIHFVGDVNQEQMASLYRGAMMTALVSLYEGFGLPIIEAMSAGTPVITSNIAAMPEVAGGAALLVDPANVPEVRAGLERLSFDSQLRQDLINRGRLRALAFDPDMAASKVWSLIERLTTEH
jgi:glycosyltransferase involved in cell wall biosynthesis